MYLYGEQIKGNGNCIGLLFNRKTKSSLNIVSFMEIAINISLDNFFFRKQRNIVRWTKKNFADEKSVGNANVHLELISIALSVWDWMV
jgi:hypothetical protein